jgi:hypothetical protein
MFTACAYRALGAALLALASGGAAGCGGGSHFEETESATESITLGALDRNDPNVARVEGGLSPCTGALISPRVVLTAGHCVEAPPTAVFFGADSAGAGERAGVIGYVAHPAFDPIQIQNDIALVLLDRPVAVKPIRWAREVPTGLQVGAPAQVVGFGITGPGEPFRGEKRSGTVRISGVGDHDLHCTPDPSLPCLGDSGGPVLVADEVVGVVSSGDSRCSDHARAMRVDAYAGSFIAPQLAAWGEVRSAQEGGCAVQGRRPENRPGLLLAVVGGLVAASHVLRRRAWVRRRPPGRRSRQSVARAAPRGSGSL